jgi:hypothetical protein
VSLLFFYIRVEYKSENKQTHKQQMKRLLIESDEQVTTKRFKAEEVGRKKILRWWDNFIRRKQLKLTTVDGWNPLEVNIEAVCLLMEMAFGDTRLYLGSDICSQIVSHFQGRPRFPHEIQEIKCVRYVLATPSRRRGIIGMKPNMPCIYWKQEDGEWVRVFWKDGTSYSYYDDAFNPIKLAIVYFFAGRFCFGLG